MDQQQIQINQRVLQYGTSTGAFQANLMKDCNIQFGQTSIYGLRDQRSKVVSITTTKLWTRHQESRTGTRKGRSNTDERRANHCIVSGRLVGVIFVLLSS
ncbi:Hypothetical_protein [Hexamita inflata]|uniref:Hypothetical_protein n=1 Tax=Hexamita inflata TaxID=28002 RepID=A0ABP1H442_9EUKA